MPTLFFSYSHADEALRKQLEVHLAGLQRQGAISSWHDRRITVGSDLDASIHAALETADAILLLISPDFIASDYCYEREMTRALEKHHNGEACVIPVILRPCDWQGLPFGKLLATPTDGRPITAWPNRDAAFLNVVSAIKRALAASDMTPKASLSPKLSPARENHPPENSAPDPSAGKVSRSPQGTLRGRLEPLADLIAPPVTVAPSRTLSRSLVVSSGLLLLLLLMGTAAAWQWLQSWPFRSVSVKQITSLGSLENVAISADGRLLAEVKSDDGQRTLWIRNIATNTETQISSPFPHAYVGLTFSPDGNYLYFTRGTPENNAVRGLYSKQVFGGTPLRLINVVDSAPSFSPDGNRITYLRWTPNRQDQYSEIRIADKDGGNDQLLYSSVDVCQAPVWSPPGKQVAWIEVKGSGEAMISILDLSNRKITSIAQPGGISFDPVTSSGRSDLAWLPDGRHLLVLYFKSQSDRAQIGKVRVMDGKFQTLTNDVSAYSQLALSADGKTLATVLNNVNSSIAFYKGDGGPPVTTTPLHITPTRLAWADENNLLLINRYTGISLLNHKTGALQSINSGDLDPGNYITTCGDGRVLFTAGEKAGRDPRLFRMNSDGSDITQLTKTGVARSPSCTKDHPKAYFTIRNPERMSSLSLWSVSMSGGVPQKELDVEGQGSINVSPDTKLAEVFLPLELVWYMKIIHLDTHIVDPPVKLDTNYLVRSSYPSFSPDSKAIVEGVGYQGGNALRYQPINGSPSHLLTEPTHDRITAFAWSPSGTKLALVHLVESSDVVLITDLAGKQQ